MSQSASQASKFYKEVAKRRKVWTIRDQGGFPAPLDSEGKRAQPFWSTLSRVEKIIKSVPAYSEFVPHELDWDEFVKNWVPGLTKDKILVGINWTGHFSTGYDLDPETVKINVEAQVVT